MVSVITRHSVLDCGSGLFIIMAVIIMIIKPFSVNLNDTAHLMLGGIIIALGIWVFLRALLIHLHTIKLETEGWSVVIKRQPTYLL